MALSDDEYTRAIQLLFECHVMLRAEEQRGKKRRKYNKRYFQDVMTFSDAAIHEVELWEKRKVWEWRKCGRLTADGTLRLVNKP